MMMLMLSHVAHVCKEAALSSQNMPEGQRTKQLVSSQMELSHAMLPCRGSVRRQTKSILAQLLSMSRCLTPGMQLMCPRGTNPKKEKGRRLSGVLKVQVGHTCWKHS